MPERDNSESQPPVESRPNRSVELGEHRGVTLDSNIDITPSPSVPTEPAMPPSMPPPPPPAGSASTEE
jgi:hypothetical protein